MKWGRKKTSFPSSHSPSPPCSRPSSLISHVFPVSWLSKFKHKSGNSEPKPRKGNPKGNWNSPPLISSPRYCASSNGNGQFYGLEADDDAFWRLSFGQDGAEEKKKILGMKSVWHDPNDELRTPVPSCPNCRRKEAQKSNKERELRSPTSNRTAKERKSRGESGAFETRRKCRYVSPVGARNPGLKTIEEEGLNLENSEEHSKENTGFHCKVMKELKMKEVKSRNEKQRKSVYLNREEQQRKRTKQINKARTYSPRTASRLEVCKVKALEDMKKAKLKMKKKKKEVKERGTVEQSKTGLDSFAVVKSSFDPQKDFKDSMVEMIVEKKMSKPEELEELLACYLTLNSDEYHDMIIKVFRHVWFELGQSCFSSELQNEQISSD